MTWQLNAAHSSVGISTKHMMISTVRGKLAIREATIDFDPAHPERGSVVAVLDAASIDTGMAPRDEHLRSPDFLDAGNHPDITFRSARIEAAGDRYRIHGELTIRDTTLPIVLDAGISGVVAEMGGGRRAAFQATTVIERERWGLGWNVALETGGWLVGKEFRVEIEIAAVEAAAEAAAEAAGEAGVAAAA